MPNKRRLQVFSFESHFCVQFLGSITAFSERIYSKKEQLDIADLEKVSEIGQFVFDQLIALKNPTMLTEVFLPFYDEFWRKVLFDAEKFEIVTSICERFVASTNGKVGLFDYAYGLQAQGKRKEAEEAYQQLTNLEPQNAAAINNLGVIKNQQGFSDEALDLFTQAAALDPANALYSKNRDNTKHKIESRNQSERRVKEYIDEIKLRANQVGIDSEKLIALNSLYWQENTSAKEIADRFGIQVTTKKLNMLVMPLAANENCPNCQTRLVFKSRHARAVDEKTCLSCGHQSKGWCRCSYCRRMEEARAQKAEEARRLIAIEGFKKLQAEKCKPDYVAWALSKLSRKEKSFLKSFIEVVQDKGKIDWKEICGCASVVSEKSYVLKLRSLKLLLDDPTRGLVANTAVQLGMLEQETVRRIPNGLRFEVLQRDNHTCKYCGRTPPDVELEIDHLIPVDKGGTDAFDNLVTSCFECNSGKSDKLIKEFTGGYDRKQWSEQIRAKRTSILLERRESIEGIREFWKELLDRRMLSERDDAAIHKFVELYEPDWIKAAIQIALRKKIQNYISYTGGILRRWAKEGPPENLSNPYAGLAKKPATPRQITYIASLLERAGLTLTDVCDKTEFDQLTMLDVQTLISTLTEKSDE